jgi:hypothetical protein
MCTVSVLDLSEHLLNEAQNSKIGSQESDILHGSAWLVAFGCNCDIPMYVQYALLLWMYTVSVLELSEHLLNEAQNSEIGSQESDILHGSAWLVAFGL